jgi:sortase A
VRVVISQEPLRRILWWFQRALLAGAVSILAYCGFVLNDTLVFQKKASRQLERSSTDPPSAAPKNSPLPAIDGLIGRIEIPRIRLSVMVIEGTTGKTLRRAAGHISGTGIPGQPGNIGISAHRDTFFRPLRNVRRDDIITLTTLGGEYRYRVVSIKIVKPYNVAVLDRSGNEVLTLVTCYPFYFVGPAPDRFIVRAERITAD